MTKIKLCGLSRKEDILCANELLPDYIGFVFAKGSRRYVSPDDAKRLRELADSALKYIPERVRYYAPIVGVSYGRITIRSQRTRWGSCSSKGHLNFNCLLILAPPEVIDSIVVHELCHRKEMNHSPRFYAEVLRVYPDYYKWNDWLKKNGAALLARLPR